MLGVYINADEIQVALGSENGLNLVSVSDIADPAECIAYISQSSWTQRGVVSELLSGREKYLQGAPSGYLAAAVSDYLRWLCINSGVSFSYETVLSDHRKVLELEMAQHSGFRTYLYYVATSDYQINIERVANRVRLSGHAVPVAKIKDRYKRSLENLADAIRFCNRAYIFDNSGPQRTLIGQFDEGELTLMVTPQEVPEWFVQYVLFRLTVEE